MINALPFEDVCQLIADTAALMELETGHDLEELEFTEEQVEWFQNAGVLTPQLSFTSEALCLLGDRFEDVEISTSSEE